MSHKAATEDLLVRARREQLDDEDERRLELSLRSSRELSLLFEAGVGFDAEASLLPGDVTRTAALVERTLLELDREQPRNAADNGAGAASLLVGPRSGARYFAVSVACGVLLSVTLASAWQYVQTRWFTPQTSNETRRPAVPVDAAPVVAPAPTSSAVAKAPAEPATTPTPASSPKAAPSTNGNAKPTASPRELFTLASEARRRGDSEGAITLYEQLCAAYPTSVEAEDARLVLGNLRLEQRSPRAALSQFESYGSGALSLEAMWGKAQALRKLDSPEERGVLEELLRQYPTSPYAAAAHKRLQQLGQ
jgi:TolA-binding protein